MLNLSSLSVFDERCCYRGGRLWTEGLLFALDPFAYRQLLSVCVCVCGCVCGGVLVARVGGWLQNEQVSERERERN